MTLGNVTRLVALLAAVVTAAGSASSSSNQNGSMIAPQQGAQPAGPPPPQAMDPASAIGIWRSTFGGVKIEADNRGGGLQVGAVQGVWTYQRQGQWVEGVFWGNLRGNVLQFRWQEPGNPPLTGEGYLVFDVQGRQFSGRWWTERRDRIGDWNGWRGTNPQSRDPYAGQNGAYGGQGYADPWSSGQQGQYGGQGYGQPPYARPPQQPGQQQPPYQGQQPPYQGQQPPYQGQQPPYQGQQQPYYPPQPQPRPQPQPQPPRSYY